MVRSRHRREFVPKASTGADEMFIPSRVSIVEIEKENRLFASIKRCGSILRFAETNMT